MICDLVSHSFCQECAKKGLILGLNILGDSFLNVTRNIDLTLQSAVVLAQCPQLTIQLKYNWTIQNLNTKQMVTVSVSDRKLLSIPKFTLRAGGLYNITLQVSASSNILNHTVTAPAVTVFTQAQPLVAFISYGMLRLEAWLNFYQC